MITKINLINWKTHENSKIEFEKGVNLIVGIIGSGKTSIMDAICFGLFGTFPDLQNRRIKIDEVIMKKPVAKNRAEVEIEFQVDDHIYKVKRIIEKDKGTTYAEFREDGKLLEVQSSQRVTELVEKVLKIDYDLFSKIVYSKQNAIDYFLTIPRGKRMKELDELLLIDKFEAARASTVSLINRINDRISEKEGFVQKIDLKSIKLSLNQLKLELEEIKKRKEELEKKLTETSRERIIYEEKIETLRGKFEEAEAIRREVEKTKSAIEELKKSIDRIEKEAKEISAEEIEKKFNDISKILKDIDRSFEEKRKEYLNIQTQLSRAETEKKLAEEKIESLEKEIKEIETELKELEEIELKYSEKDVEEKERKLEKLKTEIEIKKNEIKNIEEAILKLSEAESKCPVCESKLTEKKKESLIKKNKEREDKINSEIKEMSKEIETIERFLNVAKEKLKKLPELRMKEELVRKKEEELKTLNNIKKVSEDNIESLSKEVQQIFEEMKKIEENKERLQKERDNLSILREKIREYMHAKERLSELEKARIELESKYENFRKLIEAVDLKSEELKLREIIGKEREIAATLSSIEEIMKEKESRKEEIEKTITTLEKELEKIKELKEIAVQLKIFKSALEATQVDLRNQFVTVVNYYMNSLWSVLYPYEDFPAIRLHIEDMDYTLQLQERSGRWVNVEGVASGGERSLAALAMRVAFSLALAPQLRLLILDEPTHNLDQKSIEELAIALKDKITQFMDQIFVITHEEKLEEAVTGRAYRLERDKSIDGVTTVIPLR